MKNNTIILALPFVLAASASAAIVYSTNFNDLGVTAGQSITGTGAVGNQGAIPNLAGWQAARVAGTASTAMNLLIDNNGSGNTGGVYSDGVSASAADRSLGALASNALTPAFGLVLVNTEAHSQDSITITFTGEQWRLANNGAVANTLTFAYGFGGGSITSSNFLSSAGMTSDARGNVVSGVATASPFNVYSSTSISFTISGVNWTPGQELYIRWQLPKMSGAGANLAIDDFSLTAVPAPGAMALLGVAGLLGSRRRR
jgi:MYXO-CTERM domain-containing protein